jgi:hypothetical protein
MIAALRAGDKNPQGRKKLPPTKIRRGKYGGATMRARRLGFLRKWKEPTFLIVDVERVMGIHKNTAFNDMQEMCKMGLIEWTGQTVGGRPGKQAKIYRKIKSPAA